MKILYGKPVAEKIEKKISDEIKKLYCIGITPTLKIVRIGMKNDSLIYENALKKTFKHLGMNLSVSNFQDDISLQTLENKLQPIYDNDKIHAVLIMSPLPKRLHEIRSNIPENKDIDCFGYKNASKIYTKEKNIVFQPCTPQACIELLHFYDIKINSKNFLIIGQSLVVGKPLAMLLMDLNASVIICNKKSKNLKLLFDIADVIVVSVGKANFLSEKYLNKKHIILDVGINSINGKILGDTSFENIKDKVNAITPVPGGIGKVTNIILALNTLKACKIQNSLFF